jgi:hypothetical protein
LTAPLRAVAVVEIACHRKGNFMADAASLQDVDQRIAVARENLRELTEQAAALSGAGDEELAAERIARQQQRLDALLKEREALAK